jgi:hypothetical protein
MSLTGIPAYIHGRLCFINHQGQLVLETSFSSSKTHLSFSCSDLETVSIDGFALLGPNKKFGYLNKQGGWLIEPQFALAKSFEGDFAKIGKVAGHSWRTGQPFYAWGIIDRSGRIVVEPRFACISSFEDGAALVLCKEPDGWSTEGLWRAIDIHGRFVSDGVEGMVTGLSWTSGPWPIRIGERFGYITSTGELLIDPQYEWCEPFFEEKALVMNGGRSGFIDRSGRVQIPLNLPDGGHEVRSAPPHAFSFCGGMARICERINGDKRYGYVNAEGQIVISPSLHDNWLFGDNRGPASFDGKKFGFVDHEGSMVIAPRFLWAWEFSCDRAPVQLSQSILKENGKRSRVLRWGAVNPQGELAIECKYQSLSKFQNDVCLALNEEDVLCLLDKHGNVLLS